MRCDAAPPKLGAFELPSRDQLQQQLFQQKLSLYAKSYLRDLGYAVLEIESVLDLSPKPLEYVSRLKAARKFLALPESAGLAEADKRIRNILSKSGGDCVAVASTP